MENHSDFHHDDLLELAVDAVRRAPAPDTLPSERIDQLVATVEKAAEKVADQPYPLTMIERARKMKSRFAIKIAVTTTIVVACFGLISWLAPNGTTSMAFADVAEALNRIKTATWKTTQVCKTYSQGEPKETTTTTVGMFMAPAHERMERTINGAKSIEIIDGEKGKFLVLIPKEKRAIATSFKGLPEGLLGNTLSELRIMVTNAKDGTNKKVKQLGTETIDGRRTEVFCLQTDNPTMKYQGETKIWADPKTSLLVRVERSFRNDERELHSVMTDFKIDVELDPSLFSVDVPKGYNAPQKMQLDFSKGPLPIMAEVLGIAAEINDGVFPDSLHGPNGLNEILKRMPEYIMKKDPKDRQNVFGLSMKLSAGMAALAVITQRKSGWHYAGKGVKLDTPNRPVFWCKIRRNFPGQKLKGKYGVIYADLSLKTLSEENLPKVPETESSSTTEKTQDAKSSEPPR